MKKVGIQTDSEALCSYLGIKVTRSLQCGQKIKACVRYFLLDF